MGSFGLHSSVAHNYSTYKELLFSFLFARSHGKDILHTETVLPDKLHVQYIYLRQTGAICPDVHNSSFIVKFQPWPTNTQAFPSSDTVTGFLYPL